MRRMALPFLLILSLSLLRSCPSSAFVPLTGPHRSSLLPMIDLSSNDNIDKLRESAERLRKEAKDLEDGLGNKRRSSPPMIIPVDPTYTNLAESTWTCTYRLSSDPRNEKEEDKQISFYSGKFTVTFLADGYTNLISQEPSGVSSIVLDKVWGWDRELSNEDDLVFILFSTSVKLPADDKFAPNQEMRYYWQARIDTSSSGIISINDGTITVKKDVRPPGGFWGAFSGAGILAQFRYVGNFNSKAAKR